MFSAYCNNGSVYEKMVVKSGQLKIVGVEIED